MYYTYSHTCNRHTVKDVNKLVKHTAGHWKHTCKQWNKRKHTTHSHCRCVQTDSWPARQEWDWTVAAFPSLCGVALLWGETINMGGGRGRHKRGQSCSERKVKQMDLLSWIRDLTADGPQSLEAVPNGVNVGHSHEHHLTVGVVL